MGFTVGVFPHRANDEFTNDEWE